MVYCGKPSLSCQACRERKSRCDKIPVLDGGCTQCAKAKRVCPGYRQLGDVIFHNESEKVVRKFKAKVAKLKAKEAAAAAVAVDYTKDYAESVDSEIIDQSFELLQLYQPSPSEYTLLPTIEDRATGFFVSNFVVTADGRSPHRLDYLDDIYHLQPSDEGLISSMRAVGFAGYAHATRNPVLLRNARHQYSKALKYTNKSLASPEAATKDTTLLSIIVLGLFETLTGSQPKSIQDWSKHINGSAAVIKLRGPEQVNTIAGRRMLVQVASNLLITCLALGTALPAYINEYMILAWNKSPVYETAYLVQATMIRAARLRADVFAGKRREAEAILQEAIEIDSVLLEVTENPPESWKYEVIHTDVISPHIYQGCYHVYKDCWTGQIWNALRITRIMCHELARSTLLQGFSSRPPIFTSPLQTAQFQLSTEALHTLQNEILCSVPQHVNPQDPLTYRLPPNSPQTPQTNSTSTSTPEPTNPNTYPRTQTQHQNPSPQSTHPPPSPHFPNSHPPTNNNDPIPLINMYSGSFILWPLFSAAVTDVSTPEVKAFVVRNLRAVSDTMGVRQGYVLADIVERGVLVSGLF